MVKDLHQNIYGDDNYEPSQTVKDTKQKSMKNSDMLKNKVKNSSYSFELEEFF